MRHIVISIILIVLFLSSFGQTQQVLKNGFVAATDDGIYYLQDGFNEWVKLNLSPLINSYIYSGDSVIGISYNNNVLYGTFHSHTDIYENRITQLRLHNSNFSYNRGDQGYGGNLLSFIPGLVESKYKYKDACVFINSPTTTYTPDIYIYYDFINGLAYDYSYPRTITGLTSDTDSITVAVGDNNKLLKFIVTNNINNRDSVSISGLHSRPTDSHQICYNPDDDVFIIVSDSGIVYSYDKATVTTIDTIKSDDSSGTASECNSVTYFDGVVFVLMNYTDNIGQSTIYNLTDNTQSVINRYLFDNYDVVIQKTGTTVCIYFFNDDYSVDDVLLYYDSSGINVSSKHIEKLNRTVFDLDYINYLPN